MLLEAAVVIEHDRYAKQLHACRRPYWSMVEIIVDELRSEKTGWLSLHYGARRDWCKSRTLKISTAKSATIQKAIAATYDAPTA